MRKILFGSAIALSSLVTPLTAFDGCGACPPVCDPCCCGTDFNGFYIGGNLGVITHQAHVQDLDGFAADTAGYTTNDTSFLAGIQLGYDWQCCTKLFGLVADWNWVDNDRRVTLEPNGGVSSSYRNEHHWFSTIRARAGLVLNDAAFYLTAGAAVSRFRSGWDEAADSFSHHHTRWGWTAGVGTEFLVFCNWSIGAEVLWLNFDHDDHEFTTAGGTTFRFANSDNAWIARILVNYRFGNLFGF